MGSQFLEILRQGVWASLTGGWFFDPRQGYAANLLHLYLWLLLVSLPFSLYMFAGAIQALWIVYIGFITTLFVSLKVLNLRLHLLFDTGEALREPVANEEGERDTNDRIELRVMPTRPDGATPPVQCSSRNSLSVVHPVDSIECLPYAAAANVARTSSATSSNGSRRSMAVVKEDGNANLDPNSSRAPRVVPEAGPSRVQRNEDSVVQTRNREKQNEVAGGAVSLSPSTASHKTDSESQMRVDLSQTNSVDSLMKNTRTVEFGFMSQDPSVARARTKHPEAGTSGENRQPFRRALSEIENSCQMDSDLKKKLASPPSHPVSLEAISSQPPPPGAIPRRSMDHIRKGLSEATIQEDDMSSTYLNASPVQKAHSSSSPALTDTIKCRRRRRKTGTIGRISVERSQAGADGGNTSEDDHETSPRSSEQNSQDRPKVSLPSQLGREDFDVHFFRSSHPQRCEEDQRSSSSSVSSPDETTPSLKSGGSKAADPRENRFDMWGGANIHKRLLEILKKNNQNVSPKDVQDLTNVLRFFRSIEFNDVKGGPDGDQLTQDGGDAEEVNEQFQLEDGASQEASTAQIAEPPVEEPQPGSSTQDNDPPGACANFEDECSPPPYLLSLILSKPGTHLARSHDDTSAGAVHFYKDEESNWQTYSFNESGRASSPVTYYSYPKAAGVESLKKSVQHANEGEHWETVSQTSSSSGATLMVANPPRSSTANIEASPGPSWDNLQSTVARQIQTRTRDDYLALHQQMSHPRFVFGDVGVSAHPAFMTHRIMSHPAGDLEGLETPKARHYFIFKLFPWKSVKVSFDRLTLLAVLDRNVTITENIISISLAITVACLGSWCLLKGLFIDLGSIIFCFVMAGCQYSLLKSVQPDAASPTHGYNPLILYSRPVYFSVCCILLLTSQSLIDAEVAYPEVEIYKCRILNQRIVTDFRNLMSVMLLCFPLLFSFGLLPQVNTFLTYICEHVDIHVFGGSAVTGPISAVYCISRSILVTAFLYTFCYSSLLMNRDATNNTAFSVFCGVLVMISYHLSRSQSDPAILGRLIVSALTKKTSELRGARSGEGEAPSKEETKPNVKKEKETGFVDPLPRRMNETVLARLKTDAIYVFAFSVFLFGIHVSTVFSVLQPYLQRILHTLAISWGIVLHYLLPQLRKHLPFLCCSKPFLRSMEYDRYESTGPAKLMWFEKLQVRMWFFEKNFIYPLVILSALSVSLNSMLDQFGLELGCLLLVICSLRCLRGAFMDPSKHFIALTFTLLIFEFDLKGRYKEPILVNFFVMLFVISKLGEFLLKLRFAITYIAPFQITWGSAFHAFAQPFSVPHSAMLFIQTMVSSLLSAPLTPVLGSTIFFTSYVRPVKFWERDYNTKRVDHSNTSLSAQLERNPGSDDNNLNSIFYEHLTRSLQESLFGDLIMGRWGAVSQGDTFMLASENLNCLVHIIEYGNGLVTFQLRGLEFRGTYCQQREVEAITEEVRDNRACCCCEPGHLPGMLSVNAAFNQRWLAWEVSAAKYILEGYSISENSAVPLLQMFEVRRALMTYYVKSVIYYTITNKKLDEWLGNRLIHDALQPTLERLYVELDPVFTSTNDADFDGRLTGISRHSFCKCYLPWIHYCVGRVGRQSTLAHDKASPVVSLCFALSVLARRALGSASHNTLLSVDYVLFGLHALLKGDIRIASVRDEWVFHDMDLINKVVTPAVRMTFKLNQDHFISSEELEENKELFDTIANYTSNLVIAHEADPEWRNAVLSGVPSLLALRHVQDDNSDDYRIISLNKRYLFFRVIKVNRECVRGLWAGQQQELVYMRNRNPERGSIQNAKQALRNIINSSCDQPIGYPIYVSPLTTSFAETSPQLCSLIGNSLSLSLFKQSIFDFWNRLKVRCGEGCSSGGTALQDDVCVVGSGTGGFSAPASLSGSIPREPDQNNAPRRSHSSGSHPTNNDIATAVGGRTTTSASLSTFGNIAAGSSLGRNSASCVRTSLGNLTVSSLTKPGNTTNVTVSIRPYEQTPFVIGESAGSRSTVFGTWDAQTGQLIPTNVPANVHLPQAGHTAVTNEMTKL